MKILQTNINNYMSSKYYVYMWVDPSKDIPFYIGKGKDNRATNFHQAGRCENKRSKLLKEGFTNNEIVRIVKENLTEEDALCLEKELIEQYKRIEDGGTLFNYKICNQKGYKIIDPLVVEYIKKLYIEEKMSAKAIGERVGLHEVSVLRYLRLSNTDIHSRGSRFKFTKEEVDNIIHLYSNGLSSIKISAIYKCSVPTICIVLKENKIPIRGKRKQHITT
jgi:hypothetical protein